MLVSTWSCTLVWQRLSALALFYPLLGLAQGLRVSSVTGAPGDWVTVEVAFTPPSEHELVALQWETELPSGSLDPESHVARVLVLAKEAGKSLTCAAGKVSGKPGLRCILVGGQKPIPGGAVAWLSLKISDKAPAGAARLHFQNISGVSRDLKPMQLSAADATITIKGR